MVSSRFARAVLAIALIQFGVVPMAVAKVFPESMLLDGRVVGGVDATIEEAPYQASIRLNGFHACGGCIIDEDTIISAAHCFNVWNVEEFRDIYAVYVGSTNVMTGGIVVAIEDLRVHPDFVPATFDFDIAILKLKNRLTFGPRIQAISLPPLGFEAEADRYARLSGWGRLYYNGPLPDILQRADIKVFSRTDCVAAYEDINPLTKNMFCAGSFAGGIDSCHGDSGGPLVYDCMLVGIVSWGIACAQPSTPGVYTQVGNLHIRQWIEDNRY